MWIKVCGITRQDELQEANKLGIDAIGFMFCEKSRRAISIDRAALLRTPGPNDPKRVGVFVNASCDEIAQAIEKAGLDFVQLHGQEPIEWIGTFPVPVIRALPVGNALPDLTPYLEQENLFAILLDCKAPDGFGGQGVRFDWSLLAKSRNALDEFRIIVAGGIEPGNISGLLGHFLPFGIDVSSGVEGVQGTGKDPRLIKALAEACRRASLQAP
jgi:phosphoribosylanthranilate isomerase